MANGLTPASTQPLVGTGDSPQGRVSSAAYGVTDVVRLLLPDGRLQTLPMEEYLRGVVPAEMPPSWPLEALKAQAIAARSYATYAHKYPRHPDQGADLCTTTHCHVDRPELVGTYAATDQAVRETAGVTIQYWGQVANALYSDNCGGHTLSNEEAFRNPQTGFAPPPVPYLRGTTCPNPGPKNGHGVGMCQSGAHDMASSGQTHQEILTHYYTGVELAGSQPGTELTTAVIRGTVRDENNVPQANVQVALQGTLAATGQAVSTVFTTDTGGAFYFSGLAAGNYNLSLVGSNVKRSGLLIEEPEELVLDLTLPGLVTEKWQADVTQQSSEQPWLVGSLQRAGIIMTVEDPIGERITVISGAQPEYGPGGFKIWLRHPGRQKIRFFDQLFEVETNGNTTRVTFQEKVEPPVSPWTMTLKKVVGLRLLIGVLPAAGTEVTVVSPDGHQVKVLSGSKAEYGPGAFEIPIWNRGTFVVRFLDQAFPIEFADDSIMATFSKGTVPPDTGPQVRLVSAWMALAQAESWLASFATAEYKGLFSLERWAEAPPSPQPTPGWTMTLERKPGLPLVVGRLPQAGIRVAVEDAYGNRATVVSGSKPEYGPGAFEVPAWIPNGNYTVRFLDQSFPIEVHGDFVSATFVQQTGEQARLISTWMSEGEAQTRQASLEGQERTKGLFTLERKSP
jgi:hypothetical protein